MSCRHRRAIRKFVVYHLVFFFILTPFLASCGGGGSSDGSVGPTPTEAAVIEDAVEDQNRFAQTATSRVFDLAIALESGHDLIEDTFGTMTPSQDDIDDLVENNQEDALNLITQLEALLEEAQSAANDFNSTMEEIINQENTIYASLVTSTDATSTNTSRHSLAVDPVSATVIALGFFTLVGAGAAAYKGAVDAMNECDDMPECDPMPPATDPRMAECMKWRAEKLACTVYKWPKATSDAVTGTLSSVATTLVSGAAGAYDYKRVKFVSDTVGVIDSTISTMKAWAVRTCYGEDDTESQGVTSSLRQSMDLEFEDMTAEDIYIGTPDETGTFHNVPPGNWTFVVFIDGHLRTVTGCINTGEDEADTIIEVEVEPVPIDEIDELLENTPDEIVACSDLSDCEDGYICYLGFCEPESDFPMGSSSYVGHWRIIAENTTSNYWVADTLMMDTGRFNLQIYLWGTELGSVQRGIWSYNTRYNTLTLVDDYGSEIISGPINWENQNTDFWQTGTWAGSTEQKRYAWLKQEDEDDDCPCDGPTCPTRCPD